MLTCWGKLHTSSVTGSSPECKQGWREWRKPAVEVVWSWALRMKTTVEGRASQCGVCLGGLCLVPAPLPGAIIVPRGNSPPIYMTASHETGLWAFRSFFQGVSATPPPFIPIGTAASPCILKLLRPVISWSKQAPVISWHWHSWRK